MLRLARAIDPTRPLLDPLIGHAERIALPPVVDE
jgi:hypothetical protein